MDAPERLPPNGEAPDFLVSPQTYAFYLIDARDENPVETAGFEQLNCWPSKFETYEGRVVVVRNLGKKSRKRQGDAKSRVAWKSPRGWKTLQNSKNSTGQEVQVQYRHRSDNLYKYRMYCIKEPGGHRDESCVLLHVVHTPNGGSAKDDDDASDDQSGHTPVSSRRSSVDQGQSPAAFENGSDVRKGTWIKQEKDEEHAPPFYPVAEADRSGSPPPAPSPMDFDKEPQRYDDPRRPPLPQSYLPPIPPMRPPASAVPDLNSSAAFLAAMGTAGSSSTGSNFGHPGAAANPHLTFSRAAGTANGNGVAAMAAALPAPAPSKKRSREPESRTLASVAANWESVLASSAQREAARASLPSPGSRRAQPRPPAWAHKGENLNLSESAVPVERVGMWNQPEMIGLNRSDGSIPLSAGSLSPEGRMSPLGLKSSPRSGRSYGGCLEVPTSESESKRSLRRRSSHGDLIPPAQQRSRTPHLAVPQPPPGGLEMLRHSPQARSSSTTSLLSLPEEGTAEEMAAPSRRYPLSRAMSQDYPSQGVAQAYADEEEDERSQQQRNGRRASYDGAAFMPVAQPPYQPMIWAPPPHHIPPPDPTANERLFRRRCASSDSSMRPPPWSQLNQFEGDHPGLEGMFFDDHPPVMEAHRPNMSLLGQWNQRSPSMDASSAPCSPRDPFIASPHPAMEEFDRMPPNGLHNIPTGLSASTGSLMENVAQMRGLRLSGSGDLHPPVPTLCEEYQPPSKKRRHERSMSQSDMFGVADRSPPDFAPPRRSRVASMGSQQPPDGPWQSAADRMAAAREAMRMRNAQVSLNGSLPLIMRTAPQQDGGMLSLGAQRHFPGGLTQLAPPARPGEAGERPAMRSPPGPYLGSPTLAPVAEEDDGLRPFALVVPSVDENPDEVEPGTPVKACLASNVDHLLASLGQTPL